MEFFLLTKCSEKQIISIVEKASFNRLKNVNKMKKLQGKKII